MCYSLSPCSCVQNAQTKRDETVDQKPVVPAEAEANELRAQLAVEKKKAEKLAERLAQLVADTARV